MDLQIIQNKIFEVRGYRVMLDYHLAELYQVETRALKQAVKRNIERFPGDFMFVLSKEEANLLLSIGVSQNVIPLWITAGRLLCGKPDYSFGGYNLVFAHLSRRQVLHVSPCHRIVEQKIRRCVHHFAQLSRTGKLPFPVRRCLGIRCSRAVAGADSQCENPAFKDDFTCPLLGNDR